MVTHTDNDEGFAGYESTTIDPGPWVLIVTLSVCVLLNLLLPCFVSCGRHRQKQKLNENKKSVVDNDEAEEEADNDIYKIWTPPALGLGITLDRIGKDNPLSPPSQASGSVASTGSSVVHPSILTGAFGMKSRTQRRFRRALERRVLLEEAGKKNESFFRFDKQIHFTRGAHVHEPRRIDVEADDDDDDASLMSKLGADELSVNSFDIDSPEKSFLPKQFSLHDQEIQITCGGVNAWWKPRWIIDSFNKLVALSEWDFEMKKIMKLTIPFALQAILLSLVEIMSLAVVGRLIGTQALAAYSVVVMLISTSNEFVGGFWNALTTLCSQAVGAQQYTLAGSFLQMALLLYVIFSLPFMLLWWIYMEDVLLWFDLDEETAAMGHQFARVYIFAELVEGIGETVHGLLDVIDLENYSTVMGVSQGVVDFTVLFQTAFFFSPQLYHVALIQLGVGVLFLCLNVWFITYKGWFRPYSKGFFGSFSLGNWKAVVMMCKTAFSLSCGFLLTDGEWEILTIFASMLGPAEVVAWSILGTLWDGMEDLTEAIGDAAEVRCAFLLGSEKPQHAKVSAYKSLLIGMLISLIITSCLFIAGEDIPKWLTSDPLLQHQIKELMPLFGLGNIALTVGSMCWTLLGSQGRYRLATMVACCGSWGFTLPLAAISSVVLNLSLKAQTGAVVIGYMVSGTINAFFLCCSDWEELSTKIIESHDDSSGDKDKKLEQDDTRTISSASVASVEKL